MSCCDVQKDDRADVLCYGIVGPLSLCLHGGVNT